MSFGSPPLTGTDAEMLEWCKYAIYTITAGGQAYGSDGRILTRANLSELRALRQELEQKVDAAAGYGIPFNIAERKMPNC